MGVAAAVIGGVTSIVGAVLESGARKKEAAAAGAGAQAQLGTAQRERAEEIKLRQESRDLALQAAEFSPEELASLDRATAVNEQDIVRKERILASTDPAIIESGKQALQLLRGEEAATLDPIRRQRQEQRERLRARLRSQLGTGFETSTAGIQALNDFDQGTDTVLSNAQQQSISQLLGISAGFSAAGLQTNIGAATTLAQVRGQAAGRRVGAITGTPLVPRTTTSQFAGAPFVQGALEARADQGLIKGIAGGIGTLAGPIAGGISSLSDIFRTTTAKPTPFAGIQTGQEFGSSVA